MKARWWLAALALLIVACALMLAWPHDSLWYDEALTTYVATDSWGTLWQWVTQVDIQVPFHYVVLRLWIGLAGDSEFALRALSALCILLAAAGAIQIGQRIAGRRWGGPVGLAAGLLLALSPGTAWIAYEVRAYALALTLFVWATAVLLAILARRKATPALVIGYALLMLAALYTHYTALAGFAAHMALVGLAMLPALRPLNPRRLAGLAAPILIVGLGFAPWLPTVLARGSTDRSYFEGLILPGQSLSVMAGFIALGRQDEPAVAVPFIAGFAVLVALGVLAGLLSRRWRGLLQAVILAVIPAALVTLLVYINPKLTGRYFWPAWVGLEVLAALGIAGLVGLLARRGAIRAGLALALTVAIVALPWLSGERGGAPDSDYRAAFAYLCTQGTPDDVILLRDGTLFVTERYYGRRAPCESPRRTMGMPDALITDVTRSLDLGELQGKMRDLAAMNPPNVWVLSWQGDIMDPQALSYALLDAAAERPIAGRMFGDVRLDQYTRLNAARLAQLATEGPLTQAQWFNIQPAPGGPTLIALRMFAPRPARAGDKIVVQTWWGRGESLQPEMRGSARLTTADGGWLYAQEDQPPAGWKFYDDRWQAGIPAFGRYELTIGPDVPPGKVAVGFAVYDALDRWPVVQIPLGEIEIAGR